MTTSRHLPRVALALAAGAALGTLSAHAAATLRREGPWPDAEKTVTLDVSGAPRAEAVRKLAEAAGWSIVVQAPPGDPVDLHVKSQPAVKVLEILLGDGDYVAHREGSLVSIQRMALSAEAPAAPPVPPAPPMPPPPAALPEVAAPPSPPAPPAPPTDSRKKRGKHGEDRVVTGGNLRIEKDEVVNDVTVFGGNLDVYGTVTGDVAVMGGSARLHPGAHIMGDATTVGGALKVEEGCEVDGDVGVVGGVLDRKDKKHVGVSVEDGVKSRPAGHLKVSVDADDDDDDEGDSEPRAHGAPRSRLSRIVGDVSGAITRNALLFVFGSVLLALLTGRMEKLQLESAARPMRSFAVGLVGALAGAALLIAMCISIIGIPFAIAAVLLAIFATYAGVCAVLTTAGGAVAGHKTKNPYVHLAVGCAMFLVLGAVPFLGGLVTAAVVIVGIGVVIATHGAGMVHPARRAGDPHRAG